MEKQKMKKLVIINIDTMKQVAETFTKKTSEQSIQDESVKLIRTLNGVRNVFIQGSITFTNNQPPKLSLNSSIWWITNVGRMQYKIEQ